jgi:hypothetical protein
MTSKIILNSLAVWLFRQQGFLTEVEERQPLFLP